MKKKLISVVFCAIIVLISLSIYSTSIVAENVENISEDESQEQVENVVIDVSDGFKEYETGIDCLVAALELNKTRKNYSYEGVGSVLAEAMGMKVNQNYRAISIFYADGSYAQEDVTKAESSYSRDEATKVYFKTRDKIYVIKGTSVDENLNATYDSNYEEFSQQAYIAKYGYMPDESVYIFNSKTLKRQLNFNFDGENYTFSLLFKPSAMREECRQFMKETSGASQLPTYTSISVNAIIDKTGRIKQMEITENFSMTFVVVTGKVKNTRVNTYTYYDKDIELVEPY